MEKVEAVYEGGVLKPLRKLHLKKGEKVEITIRRSLIDIIETFERDFENLDEDLTSRLVEERK